MENSSNQDSFKSFELLLIRQQSPFQDNGNSQRDSDERLPVFRNLLAEQGFNRLSQQQDQNGVELHESPIRIHLGDRPRGYRPIASPERMPSALRKSKFGPQKITGMNDNSSIRNSFDAGLERRHFIARNNLRLNACLSALLMIAQIFPLILPWYADPNYDSPFAAQEGGVEYQDSLNIIIYKKKSRLNLIISLFSVFVNDHWLPISLFIESECPFVMKSGFECIKMYSFQYASIGVSSIDNKWMIVFGVETSFIGLLTKQLYCINEHKLQQDTLQQKEGKGWHTFTCICSILLAYMQRLFSKPGPTINKSDALLNGQL